MLPELLSSWKLQILIITSPICLLLWRPMCYDFMLVIVLHVSAYAWVWCLHVKLKTYWCFYITSYVFLSGFHSAWRGREKRKTLVNYNTAHLYMGFIVLALFFFLKNSSVEQVLIEPGTPHGSNIISHTILCNMDGEKSQFIVYLCIPCKGIVLRCLLINLKWIYCVSNLCFHFVVVLMWFI